MRQDYNNRSFCNDNRRSCEPCDGWNNKQCEPKGCPFFGGFNNFNVCCPNVNFNTNTIKIKVPCVSFDNAWCGQSACLPSNC